MRTKLSESDFVDIDSILGNLGRYKTVIATHESPAMLSHLAKEYNIYLQGRYIDLLETLSPQLTDRKGYFTLGICEYPDLIKWTVEQSYKNPSVCLVINKLAPIVATFGRGKTTEFFQALGRIEPRAPVIWFTYLDHQVIDADFPADRHLKL